MIKKCLTCKKEFKTSHKKTRYCSRECFGKQIIGEKHKNWKGGKIELICAQCNKKFKYDKCHLKRKGHGHFCSIKCKAKWQSENLIGKNNPNYNNHILKGKYTKEKASNWKGGTSVLLKRRFSHIEWKIQREKCYKRDNWTCQICKKTNCLLHLHHIVPYRITQDNSENNLITLCASCHAKEEHKYYSSLKNS